jgi:hypothetical protein
LGGLWQRACFASPKALSSNYSPTKNKKQKPQFPENTAEIKLVFHYTLAQRENRQIFLTDRIYVSTNNLMNYD